MSSASSTTPTVEELLRIVAARDSEVALLKLMVDKLKLQLLRRVRAEFGASSEQLDAQALLIDTGAPALPAAAPKAAAQPAANDPQAAADRGLPDHLPRETQVHRPDTTADHHDAAGQTCGCTACGGRLRLLGQDVSEQLEYVPAHFKVIRHVRPKLACTRCQSIFQAPAASRPIARGLPGPSLLAQVFVAKYCDHQPLYRQSRIYARSKVELGRSLMGGWIDQGHQLIDPLVAALQRYTLATHKLHADDTPVPVLAPGQGRTKTGRFWVYVRDDRPAGSTDAPAVFFRYSPDRKGEHPQAHLRGFKGVLQADAYGGWRQLYEEGATEAACWAHARRPWWELYQASGKNENSLAAEALRRIAQLYAIESDIRGQPPDKRKAERQARAGPLLAELHIWLTNLLTRVSSKSALAQAIGYSLTRWTALTRYVQDGRIEIDNNAAERALRGVALGRGNYLFMGSDAGGERAAAIYSLIETAKLNGLDPQAYLCEVMERIADHPINRVDELLPWNIGRSPASDKLQRAA